METNTRYEVRHSEARQVPVHLGRLIEQRLESIGMTKAEFGRRIHTSRQNVNSLLRKESMDTTLLLRIGEALHYNFFNHLADSPIPEIHIAPQLKHLENPAKMLTASLEVQAAIVRLNLLLAGGG